MALTKTLTNVMGTSGAYQSVSGGYSDFQLCTGLPSARNAGPLQGLALPLLFVQGTEDPLADEELMRGVVSKLGPNAKLFFVTGAVHALAPAAGSARGQAEMYEAAASAVAEFVARLAPAPGR